MQEHIPVRLPTRNSMKVAKFGGSSLASPEQIEKVCRIIESDPERTLIVVSAPGKRRPDDTKVTDLLLACAEAHLAGEATESHVTLCSWIARKLPGMTTRPD